MWDKKVTGNHVLHAGMAVLHTKDRVRRERARQSEGISTCLQLIFRNSIVSVFQPFPAILSNFLRFQCNYNSLNSLIQTASFWPFFSFLWHF